MSDLPPDNNEALDFSNWNLIFGHRINVIVRCITHAVPKLFHARHEARITTTKNKYEDYRDNHGPSSWDDRPFAAQVVAHTQLPCAKPSVWILVATRPHIKVGKKTVITHAEAPDQEEHSQTKQTHRDSQIPDDIWNASI